MKNILLLLSIFLIQGVAFSGDNITGNLYVSGNIGAGATPTTKLFVLGNGYFSGNVGIGSLSPGQALDVQGTVRSTGYIANGNVGISTTCPSGTNWVFTKGILTSCH